MVLTVGMVTILGSLASAQVRVAGTAGSNPTGPWLLFNPKVQEELKITPEQLARLKKIPNDVEAAHKEESDKLSKEVDVLANRENDLNLRMYAEVRKSAPDFLKPEQLQRFKQLEVRLLGLSAFENPEVRKSLELSDKQVAEIKSLKEKAYKEANEFSEKQQMQAGADSAKQRAAYQKVQEQQSALGKETMDKMLSQLTENQRNAWKALLGQAPPASLGGDTPLLFGSSGGLYFPAVHQELKITDEQKAKLNAAIKQVSARYEEESKKLQAEQNTCTQKLQAFSTKLGQEAEQALARALPEALSADQLKHLKQLSLRISVQLRGLAAFDDSALQEELKLSDAQKKALAGILEQYYQDAQAVQQSVFKEANGNVDKFNELMRTKRGALDKDTLDKLTGKLTPEQKKAWQELRDKPFDLRASEGFNAPQPKSVGEAKTPKQR
jgi:hypothetical protein